LRDLRQLAGATDSPQKMVWLIKKLPPVLLKAGFWIGLFKLGEADNPRCAELA